MRRGYIPGRLKRAEEKLNTGSDNLLMVLVNYKEDPDKAVERAMRENPNFVEGPGTLVLVMNYGSCREEKTTEFDDVDLKIREETERIKEYGFNENEIEKAVGTSEITAGDRAVKGERNPETGTGNREPGAGNSDLTRLLQG